MRGEVGDMKASTRLHGIAIDVALEQNNVDDTGHGVHFEQAGA